MVRIKLEEKHIYQSQSFNGSGNVSISGFRLPTDIFRYTPIAYPVGGTDENNRIGRKITTKSILTEGFLSLRNGNVNNTMYELYDGYLSSLITPPTTGTPVQVLGNNYEINTDDFPIDISIRHMMVEFDAEFIINRTTAEVLTDLYTWFNTLFVQTGSAQMASNRMQILRESTVYTGQFKIIYDKIHHLSFRHPIIHFKEVIPYKRELNFGSANSSQPTNKILLNMFIGPTNVNIDFGNYSFGQFLYNTGLSDSNFQPLIYLVDTTLKLSYVDI